MVNSVGAYEAKTHLSQLLERVAQGETIVITKHGVPIATLAPYNAVPTVTRHNAIKAMLALRAQNRAGGELQAWIREGRL